MGSSCSALLKRGAVGELHQQQGEAEEDASKDDEEEKVVLEGGGLTLLEFCVVSICSNMSRFASFEGLPDELVQQIFDTLASKNKLRLHHLGLVTSVADFSVVSYPGVSDEWMRIIGSNFHSLTRLDISGCVEVTDAGVEALRDLPCISTLRLDKCL
eukprot:CAMPEP_0173411124 /NCGR_PEP_ID=MMETSP1356-20130122/76242_1 /TAXON_ID=77927 ORGANISM="Hemiselmis virescens, Strain PCC157" /NCGR_SAMPLE_ID=MMETSP1356 /ASSEMBLY_ACC=CAM_ASM_000847 /LENGTH=156 /DNA_ID=CAMNT_0014372837 /DNA_START=266 /DNA_END=733 /DNA_ORIENTATION=-